MEQEDWHRLDWLEAAAAEIEIQIRVWPQDPPSSRVVLKIGRATIPRATLRQAIDDAMQWIDSGGIITQTQENL